ncbi:MAG: hypothetical protein ACLUCH_06110 [Lachnospirales bacterium]
MQLSLLSTNLLITIEELIQDKYLSKLLSVYTKTPIDSEDFDTNSLVNEYIFPHPYNEEVPDIQKVELRIFYPNGTFDSSNNVAISDLYFQIVCHRNLSRIMINDNMKLRELEIMDRIIQLFNGKTIKTLGTVHFKGYEYAHINKDYFVYTLVSEVMNL